MTDKGRLLCKIRIASSTYPANFANHFFKRDALMSFCFEEVMTVDLKIRGQFPARDDLLIIQIVEGEN